MKTMTVQMPEAEAQFLEAYAKERALSITELFSRYARRLQTHLAPHPENLKFTGSIPSAVDARAEHHQHFEDKHR